METRQTDPIIAELRAIREAYAARFDYDVEAMFRDIRARQEASGREYVRLPARRTTGTQKPRDLDTHGSESMSVDSDERIEPPVVVESFGDLDRKSRSAIRRAAAGAHVEALANPGQGAVRGVRRIGRGRPERLRSRGAGGPTI